MQARMVLPRRKLAVVTFALILGNVLAALDSSIVATAMPRIITELSGLEYYAWVTTAYLVASTTMVPISGKLGDLFGRKRFLLGGMIGFLVSSVLCGLAQSMPQLVVARALQGLFGGFLTSSVLASIADLYLPATRARMHGVFMSGFAFSAIAGPIVGGVLTDAFGWRSVFYVNVPLGILDLFAIALAMPRVRGVGQRSDIDVRGAVLLTATVVPLLVALTTARRAGLDSPLVLALLALAAAGAVAFAWAETHTAHPIMPFALFRTPTFRVAVVVGFLGMGAMFGTNIFIPLLYQGLLGLSATQSGVYLAPRMVAMVVASLLSGQIVSRIDRYRFVSFASLAILAVGLFLLSRVTPTTSEAEIMADLVIIGFGFGGNQPIYQNAVMSAVPHRFVGVASSQLQFWRNLGQTLGVTLFGAVLAAQVGVSTGDEAGGTALAGVPLDQLARGLELTFLIAAFAAGVAAVLALTLKEVPFRGRERATAGDVAASEAAALGE